jgi:hypothetical protein
MIPSRRRRSKNRHSETVIVSLLKFPEAKAVSGSVHHDNRIAGGALARHYAPAVLKIAFDLPQAPAIC